MGVTLLLADELLRDCALIQGIYESRGDSSRKVWSQEMITNFSHPEVLNVARRGL